MSDLEPHSGSGGTDGFDFDRRFSAAWPSADPARLSIERDGDVEKLLRQEAGAGSPRRVMVRGLRVKVRQEAGAGSPRRVMVRGMRVKVGAKGYQSKLTQVPAYSATGKGTCVHI